eukprot:362193-Chlamydomonas_euryale.AAC.1
MCCCLCSVFSSPWAFSVLEGTVSWPGKALLKPRAPHFADVVAKLSAEARSLLQEVWASGDVTSVRRRGSRCVDVGANLSAERTRCCRGCGRVGGGARDVS